MAMSLQPWRLLRAGAFASLAHLFLNTALLLFAGDLVAPNSDGGLGTILLAAFLAPLLALIAPSLLSLSLVFGAGLLAFTLIAAQRREVRRLWLVGAALSPACSLALGVFNNGGIEADPPGIFVVNLLAEAVAGALAAVLFQRALGRGRPAPPAAV